MTVNHLVRGSIPRAGAIQQSTPQTTITTNLKNILASSYDTSNKNYDTIKRLYKVNHTYYYRRRINKKLYRVSLKTKNIKLALYRKKILDMLGEHEMVEFTSGDFKLLFEFETAEELKEINSSIRELRKDELEKMEQYNKVESRIEIIKENIAEERIGLTFALLEPLYLDDVKSEKNLKEDTYNSYITSFDELKTFFKDAIIDDLEYEDYKKYKKILEEKPRMSRTKNRYIDHLKMFLDWAQKTNKINKNNSNALIRFDEIEDKKQRKEIARNFTNQEILRVLDYEHKNFPILKDIFKILAYTGMRSGELWALENKDIKGKKGTPYIHITDSKTIQGIRKIPLHPEIEDLVKNTKFPIMGFGRDKKRLDKGAWQKRTRAGLYKILKEEKEKNSTLNVHTLRGTFISSILKARCKYELVDIFVLQEVVGHKKLEKISLTTDDYAKLDDIHYKLNMIKEIDYSKEDISLTKDEEVKISSLMDSKFEIE